MFRFDCTFSNFNCTKRVQLHTILRPALRSNERMAGKKGAILKHSVETWA